MDELVFQRETLRRQLIGMVLLLEQAAQAYDPAQDVPNEDIQVWAAIAELNAIVAAYGQALVDRINTRIELGLQE